MRAAGLSVFGALLSLCALRVHAVDCNTHEPLDEATDPSGTELSQALQEVLKGPINTLCNVGPSNGTDHATYTTGSVTFQITREETHYSLEECKAAFEDIVSQCIGKDHVWGGEVFSNGVVYDVYEDKNLDLDEEDVDLTDRDVGDTTLEARGKGGKKKTPPKKTPPEKTPPKKTPKPTPTPKQKPTPKSQSQKPTPTPGPPKPKRTCKQIMAAVRRRLKSKKIAEKRSEEGLYHRSQRHEGLAKRRPKEGRTCNKLLLSSLNYPSSGKIPTAKKYGYKLPDQCDDYTWTGGMAGTAGGNAKYEAEHILEWQLITGFFLDLNTKQGAVFDNPDPDHTKGAKVDFCEYWQSTWTLPGPQTFDLDGTGKKTPFKWLAWAYPSTSRFPEELVLLHTDLNSPPKSNMWNDNQIFDKDNMATYIKTADKAEEALLQVRMVLGARKYMRDKDITAIFKEQVVRMGKMLGMIDKELPKHPRELVAGARKGTKYEPWKEQQLETKWIAYMDEKFIDAKAKTDDFLNKWTGELKKHWNSPAMKARYKAKPGDSPARKQEIAQVHKLQRNVLQQVQIWQREKAKPWKKPW